MIWRWKHVANALLFGTSPLAGLVASPNSWKKKLAFCCYYLDMHYSDFFFSELSFFWIFMVTNTNQTETKLHEHCSRIKTKPMNILSENKHKAYHVKMKCNNGRDEEELKKQQLEQPHGEMMKKNIRCATWSNAANILLELFLFSAAFKLKLSASLFLRSMFSEIKRYFFLSFAGPWSFLLCSKGSASSYSPTLWPRNTDTKA